MSKEKLGKEYILPEKQTLLDKEKERQRKLKQLKMKLASGITGEEYKKVFKQYSNLLFGKIGGD